MDPGAYPVTDFFLRLPHAARNAPRSKVQLHLQLRSERYEHDERTSPLAGGRTEELALRSRVRGAQRIRRLDFDDEVAGGDVGDMAVVRRAPVDTLWRLIAMNIRSYIDVSLGPEMIRGPTH
jgi:hypothetical protein